MEGIGILIHKIRCRERDFIEQQIADLDINFSQLRFLIVLFHKDGLTQDVLSKHVFLDKTTVTRLIKPLLAKKYIIRKQDQNDKRCYRLYLTKKARDLIPVMEKTTKRWLKILTKNIDKEKQKIALEVLEQMAKNAENTSIT